MATHLGYHRCDFEPVRNRMGTTERSSDSRSSGQDSLATEKALDRYNAGARQAPHESEYDSAAKSSQTPANEDQLVSRSPTPKSKEWFRSHGLSFFLGKPGFLGIQGTIEFTFAGAHTRGFSKRFSMSANLAIMGGAPAAGQWGRGVAVSTRKEAHGGMFQVWAFGPSRRLQHHPVYGNRDLAGINYLGRITALTGDDCGAVEVFIPVPGMSIPGIVTFALGAVSVGTHMPKSPWLYRNVLEPMALWTENKSAKFIGTMKRAARFVWPFTKYRKPRRELLREAIDRFGERLRYDYVPPKEEPKREEPSPEFTPAQMEQEFFDENPSASRRDLFWRHF